MTAKKDYNYLCGLDYSEHDVNQDKESSVNTSATTNTNTNTPFYGSIGVMNIMVSILYFCNQRPGIFVAPYLLLQDIPESNIGFVLFVSGIIALTLQTPAGQMVDETHNKTRVLIIGNLATILGCLLLSNVANIGVVTIAVTINVVSDVFVFPSLYATTLGIFGSEGIEKQAPLNETGTHSGNAAFAVLAGIIVVFGTVEASSIFYICVAMRCVGVFIIVQYINSYNIDFLRSPEVWWM
jgi:predicted MFS family arabinose efflux permease